MANLTESNTYETGIYQLETTDPVLAGSGGISNRQGQQLANRTNWLKGQVDTLNTTVGGLSAAAAISQMYTDTSVVSGTGGGVTLGASDIGKLIAFSSSSASYAFTLPTSAQASNNCVITFYNAANNGTVGYFFPGSGTTIAAYDSITLVASNTPIIGSEESVTFVYKSGVWYPINYTKGFLAAPPGQIAPFASNTAPLGWISCNGAAVSRTTYAKLFAQIGTTFGAGDGSTTFNLPDLRGEFIRGWDNGRGVDSGRTFGSFQADDFKSHVHTINTKLVATGTTTTAAIGDLGGVGNATQATGGTETRPRNVAMNYCIKY